MLTPTETRAKAEKMSAMDLVRLTGRFKGRESRAELITEVVTRDLINVAAANKAENARWAARKGTK